MAIKKRFAPKPVEAAIVAEDEDTVTVFLPNDPAEPDFEDRDGNPLYDTPEGIATLEDMRKLAFMRGNDGMQPHPKDVPTQQLLAGVQHVMNADNEFGRIEKFYRDRIRSPLTAIRAFMVLAEGGPKKANDDTGTQNPLWAFRAGTNPFYGKFKNENEEADDDD